MIKDDKASESEPSGHAPLLQHPDRALLPAYRTALHRGWSPDNTGTQSAREQGARIDRDPERFLAAQNDPDAKGAPIMLPDGSTVQRLPSTKRWIWSDGFAGTIALRWQPGTAALPPTCLGHIGYAVVPWRRGEGLATAALRAMLPIAEAVGLPHVDVTTDPENKPSLRVIEKAGGQFIHAFTKHRSLGSGPGVLYRILVTS